MSPRCGWAHSHRGWPRRACLLALLAIAPPPHQTPTDSSELLARFDELLRLTERQSNQLEQLRQEVADLKQQLALPPPSTFSRHEEAPPVTDEGRGNVVTFADLAARLEARSRS